MALLDATMLLDFQDLNATNEKRFYELGLVNITKKSTPFCDYISPTAKQKLSETSSLRDVNIPVMLDQQVVVNSTPGFAFIPANLETTQEYAFVAYDYFSGFRHYPAQYANNTIDEQWALKEKMKNVFFAMGNAMESTIATVLEARKTQVLDYTTQVSQGDGTFTFNAGTDTLEVSKAAQKETMFYNVQTLMRNNKLPGQYSIVVSPGGLAVQMSEALKYGADNSKNLQALEFFPMDRIHQSFNISAGSDVFNGYMLRDGAIGMYENFPHDFRMETNLNGGSQKWSVSDMPLPFCQARANVYVNNQATEATALVSTGVDTNLKMTHFQEMAFWIRVYYVYPFNSDLATRPNDVVKIKGLTS